MAPKWIPWWISESRRWGSWSIPLLEVGEQKGACMPLATAVSLCTTQIHLFPQVRELLSVVSMGLSSWRETQKREFSGRNYNPSLPLISEYTTSLSFIIHSQIPLSSFHLGKGLGDFPGDETQTFFWKDLSQKGYHTFLQPELVHSSYSGAREYQEAPKWTTWLSCVFLLVFIVWEQPFCWLGLITPASMVSPSVAYWSLDTRSSKCSRSSCSLLFNGICVVSSGESVFSVASKTSSHEELRAVGAVRKKSLSGALGVVVNGVTPLAILCFPDPCILPVEYTATYRGLWFNTLF